MNECALLGGGGFAIELLDYMMSEGKKPIGYYSPEQDNFFNGILSWLGDEREAYEQRLSYIIASGAINIRFKMIEFIAKNNLKVASFISHKSYISSFARIGKGAVIVPNAMLTGNPIIGNYFFMNAQSLVGHHATVGNNVVVGPGVYITGYCQVGDNVVFGANSSLLPKTKVGNNSEIGICTFPKKKVSDNKIVVSMPGATLNRI